MGSIVSSVRPVTGTPATEQPQTTNSLEALVAQGKARVTLVKPKVAVGAAAFRQSIASGETEEGAKPTVNVALAVDADGAAHVILPAAILYGMTRDTTSKLGRGIYAVSKDSVTVMMVLPEETIDGVEYPEQQVPMTLTLTGANLRLNPGKVTNPDAE